MSWEDRIVEFPNRVVLTPVPGEVNTYDMTYEEGEVEQEGTLLNAENMENETKELIEAAITGDIAPANIKAGRYYFKGKRAKNTTFNATIKFDKPFSKIPTVTATPQTTVPHNRQVGVSAVTTAGFTLYCHTVTALTDGITVHWQAIGV